MNKIQVYHVIYHTVKNNKGITLNQLSGLVSTALELEFEVVKAATETLMHEVSELPRCINYFHIPKEKTRKGVDIIHLRCSEKVMNITEEFLIKNQLEQGYVLPDLTAKRVNKNAPVFKEA
jgi:HEPN domain-containing protein